MSSLCFFAIMRGMKSYTTLNDYYRTLFGEKTFKVPIDAGFDCPNRDGTVARGGCTFCTVSGSGDAIVAPDAPIRDQFYKEIDFMHRKWPDVKKYLVYFQNFTNTHESVDVIRERYEQAINEPGVVGINIGTRPDCLPDETLAYLAELGLIPETLKATNLGALKVGDSVNLETDALAKYVQRLTAFAGVPQADSAHSGEQVAPRRADAASVLDSVQTAVDAIAAGRAVVVVDDEDRENEGDIIFAAEHATPELMGFMIRYTSGVVCAP